MVKIDTSQFVATFFEEAADNVGALEEGLLALEQHPGDSERLNAIFRAAHSIKGGAGTFGLQDVARFTHALEGLLDSLREGQRRLDAPLSDLLLRATDALGGLLRAAKEKQPRDPRSDDVLAQLHQVLQVAPAEAPAVAEAAPKALRDWEITFTPGADLFRQGGDPVLVLRELSQMGELLEVRTDTARLPPLAELEPESSWLGFHARLRSERSEVELRDVFCFVEDGAVIELRAAAPAGSPAAPEEKKAWDGAERRQAPEGVLRVSVDKVDHLVNLVGELVITQSMVQQALTDTSPAGLHRLREAVAEMERNTRELQERVMGIRMVPLGTVFNRFHRLLRDLAGTLGKKIALEISGDETELDKGVIERIGDPLTHLVRNAADHGIETPDVRRAAGKPEQGTLKLCARHQGGSIVIEVSDDGRGLDPVRIRAKAVEQGLIAADADLTVDQLYQLVFLPGFSTAQQVSDLSGRGVGMDVVKRNIEALGGAVALESRPGQGTTCRIRLPLTMAILDGLTLRVGDQLFVLPLVNILESVQPKAADVQTVLGRGELVKLRGETVPLVRLHELFSIEPTFRDPTKGLVSVLDAGGTRVALLVDELLGQAQVVVKSLEQNYRRVEGVTGATILGDGRVALILDVGELARRALGGARGEAKRAVARADPALARETVQALH